MAGKQEKAGNSRGVHHGGPPSAQRGEGEVRQDEQDLQDGTAEEKSTTDGTEDTDGKSGEGREKGISLGLGASPKEIACVSCS